MHISIPRDESETIQIQGYEDKANQAKQAIEKIVADHEKEQEERTRRSFKVSVDVPLEYHQRLIGLRFIKFSNFKLINFRPGWCYYSRLV